MPKTVKVSQEQIDRAITSNSNRCMIAESVKDSIPGVQRVLVDTQRIAFTVDGQRKTFLTPPVVQQAILDFDYGQPVKPFNFRMPTPIHVRSAAQGKTRVEVSENAVGGKYPPPEKKAHLITTVSSKAHQPAIRRAGRRFGLRGMRASQLEASS